MTRKDPLETAKAILEGNTSLTEMDDKEMKNEMSAMKEAMMKELHDKDASEEEVAEMMDKMEAMSYKEMKEMMAKEGIKYETYVSEDEMKKAKKAAVILDVDDNSIKD